MRQGRALGPSRAPVFRSKRAGILKNWHPNGLVRPKNEADVLGTLTGNESYDAVRLTCSSLVILIVSNYIETTRS